MKLTLLKNKSVSNYALIIICFFAFIVLMYYFSKTLVERSHKEHQIEADLSFSSEVSSVNVKVIDQSNQSTSVKLLPVMTKWQIKILSNGEKNPGSRSSEVWIFGAETPENRLNPVDVITSGPRKWSIVSDKRAIGGTLYASEFSGPKEWRASIFGSELTLFMLNHSFSGQATIIVNGVPEKVDLYAPSDGVIIPRRYSRSMVSKGAMAQGRVSFTLPLGKYDKNELFFETSGQGAITVSSVRSDGKLLVNLGKNRFERPSISKRITDYTVGSAMALGFVSILLGFNLFKRFNEKIKIVPFNGLELAYENRLVLLVFVGIILRLPAIFQQLPPWSFGDEDLLTHFGYHYFNSGKWKVDYFRFGGFNYYYPMILLSVFKIIGVSLSLSEFIIGCRLLTCVFLPSISVVLIYKTTLQLWNNEKAALSASLVFLFSPMNLGLSQMAYPDYYIVFFSTCILYLFCKQLLNRTFSYKQAILAGVALGTGVSVKYYFVLFGIFPVLVFFLRKDKELTERFQAFVITGVFCLITAAALNWSAFTQKDLFLEHFYHNVNHYLAGHQGLESDFSSGFYLKIAYLTLFGVLAIIPFLFGSFLHLKENARISLPLLLFPLLYIFWLGQYKVAVLRNMTPVIPFITLYVGFGLYKIASRVNESTLNFRKILVQVVVFLFCIEPLYRTAASVYHDFLPDSRQAAVEWSEKNIPSNAKVAVSRADWGMPISSKFNPKVFAIPVRKEENECFDFYSMDLWYYEHLGLGNNIFDVTVYQKLLYLNPTQVPYYDLRSVQDQFLSQYEVIAEFTNGYYGPGVKIFKRKVPCNYLRFAHPGAGF